MAGTDEGIKIGGKVKYAQYKAGNKLHIVLEPGEETPSGNIVRKGYLSNPLCGQRGDSYRMTINVPLAHACKKCVRISNR